MKTKHIIIALIILIGILFFTQKKEHAGSTPPTSSTPQLSNEAIQNIAKVYADTSNSATFNNINITSNTKLNGDVDIPKWRGMITMWSGDITKIPPGWALCDGTNGTPDLRGRFVLGYNPTQQTDPSGGTPRKQRNMNVSGGNEQLIANIGFNWWSGGDWENGIIYDAMKEGGLNVLNDGTSSGRVMVRAGRQYYDLPDIATAYNRKTRTNGDTAPIDPRPASVTGRYTTESLPPYYVLAYIMKL